MQRLVLIIAALLGVHVLHGFVRSDERMLEVVVKAATDAAAAASAARDAADAARRAADAATDAAAQLRVLDHRVGLLEDRL